MENGQHLIGCISCSEVVWVGRSTFRNLVTFGDSYTDVNNPGDHSISWPTFAAQDGGFQLFLFAQSGAVCSKNITPSVAPSVFESQLPSYFSQLDPNETLYTLWIGTNNVGCNNLLTGQAIPGVTVVDTTECAVGWVTALYEGGARNFLQNSETPLQRTVLYSANSYPNPAWHADRNTTEWNIFMTKLVNTGNALSRALLQILAPTLPGLFDSYAFFTDMLNNPSQYLNGTVAPNITTPIQSCVYTANSSAPPKCTTVTGDAEDSYFW
ncbi:carbohydrate esterase family 16 protein [Phlebiopsis gigantea 11061_1 CR5-6]|uniref:Carbohydrate esterase family 16 protein n=1 Tax=Phlebiopsis gigantea (strain 11061_1 CR5-6) TaxID=745531 RepID=A0A0C3PFJ0_PHLG1|nr:carbohydrate esterase family 16 protein [Phlebiopsis gigantea 11061_1 CR5-6]